MGFPKHGAGAGLAKIIMEVVLLGVWKENVNMGNYYLKRILEHIWDIRSDLKRHCTRW